MGDESVRELERRWRQSGDPQDEGRWLLARARAGQLAQAALETAAWLGAPGAVHAAPGAAEPPPRPQDPWAGLLRWSARLDELLAPTPAASHRAALAEGERLLLALSGPLGRTSVALFVVEGPRAGDRLEVRGVTYLDARGAQVEARAATLALAIGPGGELELRARAPSQVLVNGEAVTRARLEHGDLVTPGGETLLIVDTGDPGGGDLQRAARAWLDELSARVLAQGAAPPEPPPLPWIQGGSHLAVGRWLEAQLPALDDALRAGRPLALWPPELSPPPALQGAWARDIRTAVRDALAPWLLGQGDPLRDRTRSALDRLEVIAPCSMRWEELTPRPGDPRVRDCDQCQLPVVDLVQLTRDEATALVAERTGRLCVRLYRRPDGRVMTRDCHVGLPAGTTLGVVLDDRRD